MDSTMCDSGLDAQGKVMLCHKTGKKQKERWVCVELGIWEGVSKTWCMTLHWHLFDSMGIFVPWHIGVILENLMKIAYNFLI